MTPKDPFDLSRFVDAQKMVIDDVMAELRDGRKRTHWMWFVFPQIIGLGSSAVARHYAIGSLAEARAYLAHEMLGPRLVDCTARVNAVPRCPIEQILGQPDDLKFRSSMTLFARADPQTAIFRDALARYHGGIEDPATIERLYV